MFLQQTNEMLLCYNVLPLHDPMERFCEQSKKILRNDIKKKNSVETPVSDHPKCYA